MTHHSFSTMEEIRSLGRDDELLRWAPENPFEHGPDRHLVLTSGGGNAVVACCSFWWRETPLHDGAPVGAIGHFFARDSGAAREVLEAAFSELRKAGSRVVIGPMDGNTWRRYRWLTRRGEDPLFFMEPDNPPEWPGWFEAAGFSPLARYTSNMLEHPPAQDDRLERTRERMERAGVCIRNMDSNDFEGELRRIYAVSEISFRENFLFSPLPEELFVAQYRKIQPVVRPELVLIAEKGEQPVGFAFAIPDLLERQAGRPPQTAILKTLAVLPGREYAGLGTLLAGVVREKAAGMGFPRMIHALMHEKNTSRNLAKEGARVIREYTLYAREL